MGSAVGLVRVQSSEEEIKDSICKALDLINFEINKPVRIVAIKPNLCYYWDAATGYTTAPGVVAGIIDWVRESYGDNVDIKVVEADATAMRTKMAFSILGYEKLAKEKEVELFNLSRDSRIVEKVSVKGHETEFEVPKLLLKADLFINVPKLKIMRETRISCAMKNVFGCIASRNKIVYHPFLNEAIVGIGKILHPDLTIVDGLVALGRFPIRLGLLMGSSDAFSIDWIASEITGYNPSKIEFLKIAMKEELGDPRGTVAVGESIDSFRRIFPRESLTRSRNSWNIQLGLLRLYNKVVGDIIPPILEEG